MTDVTKKTVSASAAQESPVKKWRLNAKALFPYLGLALVTVIFQIASGGVLLTGNNIKLLINQSFLIMCGAMGASFVLAQGNMDMSLGGVVGITATVGVIVAKAVNPLAGLLASLAVGALSGLIIGSIHVVFDVPAIITSICMMFILRGATWVLNDNGSISMPPSMAGLDIFRNRVLLVVVVFIVLYFLFAYTKFGKYSVAIGANPLAAHQSGVSVARMKILAFVISGLVGGLCGYMSMVRSGASSTGSGTMFEINVLTSLMLGGMPLGGGAASRMKAGVIGALTLVIMQNGLVIWGVNDKLQQAITGIILIAAVALSYNRENLEVID